MDDQIIQVNAADPVKFLQAVDELPGVPPADLEEWAIAHFKDLLTPSPSLRGVSFRFCGLMGVGASLSLLIDAGKQIWVTPRGWWMAVFCLLLIGILALATRWLIEYHWNFKFLLLAHWAIIGVGFLVLGAIALWA
jgi:hypothetical protein